MLFNFQGTIPRKTLNGGVAHLGERLNGIQEVEGSIPFVSTKVNESPRRKLFIENRIKNENETDN